MNQKIKPNPRSQEIGKKFEELVDVMHTLRSEGGCSWDRAQTVKDLKQYLLEETYELLQTLDQEDETGMKEELGDLLFQIVFLSQVMQERKSFTLVEVLSHLLEKMIGRHPHVFADTKAESPEKALASWESMKMQERGRKAGGRRTLLEGIPLNFPALLQANLISSKVARVGFDWETDGAVWNKFEEEIKEFQEASTLNEKEEEMGDILFTLVNVARKNGINPEDALRAANAKFRGRFNLLEEEVRSRNQEWKDLGLKELDEIWNQVKKNQKEAKSKE